MSCADTRSGKYNMTFVLITVVVFAFGNEKHFYVGMCYVPYISIHLSEFPNGKHIFNTILSNVTCLSLISLIFLSFALFFFPFLFAVFFLFSLLFVRLLFFCFSSDENSLVHYQTLSWTQLFFKYPRILI